MTNNTTPVQKAESNKQITPLETEKTIKLKMTKTAKREISFFSGFTGTLLFAPIIVGALISMPELSAFALTAILPTIPVLYTLNENKKTSQAFLTN